MLLTVIAEQTTLIRTAKNWWKLNVTFMTESKDRFSEFISAGIKKILFRFQILCRKWRVQVQRKLGRINVCFLEALKFLDEQ